MHIAILAKRYDDDDEYDDEIIRIYYIKNNNWTRAHITKRIWYLVQVRVLIAMFAAWNINVSEIHFKHACIAVSKYFKFERHIESTMLSIFFDNEGSKFVFAVLEI